MKINKKTRNNFLFSLVVLFFLGLSVVVAKFLPNQLAWKIFNKQGDFARAESLYPRWNLALENNKLDLLYQDKKYTEIAKKITKIEEKDCSETAEKISVWCENIFYLDGLVQYRLGEKEETEVQEKFNQKAIEKFQNVLRINPDNIWARENIDFILKKEEEKQKKNEEQKKNKEGTENKDNNQDSKNQGNDNQEKDSQDGQENKKKDGQKKNENSEEENNTSNNKNSDNQEEDNQEKDGQDNQDGKQKSTEKQNSENNQDDQEGQDSSTNSKESNDKTGEEPSRLPSQLQQALAERQQELEEEQEDQSGFARSQAQAEQNKQESADPFAAFQNDPFFQSFFGNDPFFNPRQKPQLQQTISHPDEKDW